MALTMKEKYARVNLNKLPADLRKEFEGIKDDSDNFDPELVPIFEDNFRDAYALAEKYYPDAIRVEGKSNNDQAIDSEIEKLIEDFDKEEEKRQKKLQYHPSDIDDPDLLREIIWQEFEECRNKKMIMEYDVMSDDEDLMKQIEKTSNLIQRLHSWGHPLRIMESWNKFYKNVTGEDFQLDD